MQPSAQGTDLWRQGLRVFPALGGTSVSQALGSAHSGLLALHFLPRTKIQTQTERNQTRKPTQRKPNEGHKLRLIQHCCQGSLPQRPGAEWAQRSPKEEGSEPWRVGNTAVKKGLHNNGVGFARCRGSVQVGAPGLSLLPRPRVRVWSLWFCFLTFFKTSFCGFCFVLFCFPSFFCSSLLSRWVLS